MWRFVLLLGVTGKPLNEVLREEEKTLEYLKRYGYIQSSNGSSPQLSQTELKNQLKQSIIKFQTIAGLPPTGIVDSETREMMERPRCGFKDVEEKSGKFVLAGSSWPKKRLTYRVTKYPRNGRLRKSEVDRQVKIAFTMWEEVSGLSFSYRASGDPDIEIKWESFAHGDGDPFDGRGGTLAHGFYPRYGGD